MKKTHIIILVAAAVAAVVFLSLPTKLSSRVKNLGSGLFLPFFKAKSQVDETISALPERLKSPSQLRKRIEELESELAQSRIQIQETEELRRQLNNLAQFINFPEYNRWEMVAGRVIFRDPSSWWRTVNVDLGRKQGMQIGMPVVTDSGLVGKIIEVHKGYSKIQLIGDDKCRVGAMLTTGEAGIIRVNNSNRVNPMIVDMDYLPSYSTPKQGDWVVTSGLGDNVPKGIRIGQILDSETIEFGLYKQARIKLTVNLSSLEQIWVIKNWKTPSREGSGND